MTLQMRDREKFAEGKAEGRAEGRAEERILAIQKMIQAKLSKELILGMEYTEEEYVEAEKALCQMV